MVQICNFNVKSCSSNNVSTVECWIFFVRYREFQVLFKDVSGTKHLGVIYRTKTAVSRA